jgi:hypothetical protein
MARIIFNDFQAYNDARLSELKTIEVGSPIFETDEQGLLTGRFIVDHQFTAEQLKELGEKGIEVEAEIAAVEPSE